MQDVLQADWQEAWHFPQPPLAAVSLRLALLIVLMCFIIVSSIQSLSMITLYHTPTKISIETDKLKNKNIFLVAFSQILK